MSLKGILGIFIFVALGYYVTTPQISLDSPGLLITLMVLFGYVGTINLRFQLPRKKTGYYAKPQQSKQTASSPAGVGIAFMSLAVVTALVLGVQVISSLSMVRSTSYEALLGVESVKDYKTSLPPIDEQNAPLVSYQMAKRAAEKKLSEVTALGSQAHVGDLQKQRIGNTLYWVGFLEHRGFFAWYSQGATPGYVRVSATDASDAELVTSVKDKPLHMRYLNSGYFGDDAERHLRFSGYATKGLTDFSPEVDDEGNPFLVVTVFDRTVGLAGNDATGVIVLDVQTGEQTYYAVKDVPAWVDRVQPQDFVEEQIHDRLEYVHGWLNPSNKDKLAIAGEMDLVYGTDGKAYFYAGITSVGRDNGVVGFMLVNTRTKEATRYSLVGVTESVAQSAVVGVIPEKRYTATNALPFMVDGNTPAYVMALQDETGIARAYGIVDMTDFQRVAVADTLAAALRSFQSTAGIDRTSLTATSHPSEVVLKAKVLRIASEVRGGNSSYTLVLDGQPGKLFAAAISRSDDLAVTKELDVVEIRTLLSTQHVLPVLAFKNVALHPADVVDDTASKK
jgi:hypothetical protein